MECKKDGLRFTNFSTSEEVDVPIFEEQRDVPVGTRVESLHPTIRAALEAASRETGVNAMLDSVLGIREVPGHVRRYCDAALVGVVCIVVEYVTTEQMTRVDKKTRTTSCMLEEYGFEESGRLGRIIEIVKGMVVKRMGSMPGPRDLPDDLNAVWNGREKEMCAGWDAVRGRWKNETLYWAVGIMCSALKDGSQQVKTYPTKEITIKVRPQCSVCLCYIDAEKVERCSAGLMYCTRCKGSFPH